MDLKEDSKERSQASLSIEPTPRNTVLVIKDSGVHVHMYMHVCKHTHTGALENQKSMLSAFLSHSPPYILRTSLSLNLEFTLGLADQ